MAPRVSAAKAKVSIPLYAVDFDPEDPSYLVVGGGGGESKSGVGNKLILLKASHSADLQILAEADLSRDEDSVTSLAVANTGEKNTLGVIAGINSSTAEQQANKNEHLRSFKVTVPTNTEKVSTNSIKELGRASLFKPSSALKKETYQRTIRLSPAKKGVVKRLAAIATGLAPEGEVIAFKFDGSDPTASPYRIGLKKKEEAADIDIIDSTGEEDYCLCFCTDHQIFHYKVGEPSIKTKPNPRSVFEVPHPDVFEQKGSRQTLRAIRFLAPHLVLVLANFPGRKGAELLVVRFGENTGSVITRKRLHGSFKAGTSLDVVDLDPQASGTKQLVIAAAGIDSSIAIFTLDYHPQKGVSGFSSFTVLQDVHPLQITKIAFSTFFAPSHPISASTPPQAIKLASVSLGNTVNVHSFPLTPVPERSKTPRYVLRPPGQFGMVSFGIVSSLLVLLFSIFLFQALIEIRGASPPILGVTNWLSPEWQSKIAQPYTTSTAIPSADSIRQLLDKAAGSGKSEGAIVLKHPEDGELSAKLHPHEDVEQQRSVKKWEDLKPAEQSWWRKKLSDAGHLAADEGDTILKSVFFSEIAGFVGQAVGG